MADATTELTLKLVGRAMLQAAGLTDEDIRDGYEVLRRNRRARRTKAFVIGGDVKVVDLGDDAEAQLRAASETLRIADHFPSKLEHEVHGEVTFTVNGLDPDKV